MLTGRIPFQAPAGPVIYTVIRSDPYNNVNQETDN